MPDYSLNWTVKSSGIQGWQRCQWCNSITRRWPCRSRGLLASRVPCNIYRPARMSDSPLKSLLAKLRLITLEWDLLRIVNKSMKFVSASHQTRVDTRSMTWRSIIVGIKRGEDQARTVARALLDYAGHRPTEQYGPDEPSCTWTQIGVQTHMPEYTLTWTARSCDIQGSKRCQWYSSNTLRRPSRRWGLFGLKSAMEYWSSVTDDRRFADKYQHEAAADHAGVGLFLWIFLWILNHVHDLAVISGDQNRLVVQFYLKKMITIGLFLSII